MNNNFCEPGTHSYGLWKKKDNKGIRTCYKCSYTEELPLTNTIKEQIDKQEKAEQCLKGFTLVNENDEKIIGYINVMLKEITYLDREQIKELNKKIDELKNSSLIDTTNAVLLTSLQTTYHSNKEIFDEFLEKFQLYNQRILQPQKKENEGYTK